MAFHLPTLYAAPSTFLLVSSPHSRQTNSIPATARRHRRRNPARPVKATTLAEEASTDCDDTKLSAWTSVRQERWEGELAVEGRLPDWLNGTYLRNGPGLWDVGGGDFHHLFDGYATLVRISFRQGRATGAHRQIESDAYKAAVASGRPVLREFSQCPKPRNLLDRVTNAVGIASGAGLTDNPNSAVLPLGDGRVLCVTETTKSSILIDPDTLATVGKFEYADGLGGMMIQSAHPIVTESELLTVLPDLARPGHLVVRMAVGSDERKVVGRVGCRGGPTPGWMHSFAVTENYVVVPEMPLRYSASSLVKSELAPYYAFEWLPASGSYMHVMCRSTGKTVASVEVPPFMAIHYINAYEEKDEDGRAAAVIVDCCEHYGDPAIIETLVLHRLRSLRDEDVLPNARVGRFTIPLDGSPYGELETALGPEEHGRGLDMCSINPAYLGKRYRYAYACGARRPCNFPNTVTKIDLVEKTAKNWHDEGAVPSEPFFVARPGATDEDDGVVISIVSAVGGDGYALVLDATTFQEIARVRFPYGLPYGFHGCWIPDKDLTRRFDSSVQVN
ncbi:carotenoid cleavage dioxygenase 8 homolog A, chloroplastic [Setaria viridis]|uniref:carotenoid cleavage dioxygenase 8 homolog A, chloroplastic n=1 Tax=Setaria viridis TaxID=4556 RepID=UPI001493CAF1|nr:carotenoid cleavage dioxygenase 8 homolog A, chloroplastic-like [Setaria viridis]